ncbi:hypothetical protein GCM10025331_21800 [Actinoplanes utahensis]|nr:hypothetical protein Aut01nite_35590 [Actinoplanes utahensis]
MGTERCGPVDGRRGSRSGGEVPEVLVDAARDDRTEAAVDLGEVEINRDVGGGAGAAPIAGQAAPGRLVDQRGRRRLAADDVPAPHGGLGADHRDKLPPGYDRTGGDQSQMLSCSR